MIEEKTKNPNVNVFYRRKEKNDKKFTLQKQMKTKSKNQTKKKNEIVP